MKISAKIILVLIIIAIVTLTVFLNKFGKKAETYNGTFIFYDLYERRSNYGNLH
ncbi:MAG: hypothetical protein LBS21_10330 [Clostridiales bacterium]|jgi:hypothetical protein|nr:hypothetical protein [Clostridiales bacterium]